MCSLRSMKPWRPSSKGRKIRAALGAGWRGLRYTGTRVLDTTFREFLRYLARALAVAIAGEVTLFLATDATRGDACVPRPQPCAVTSQGVQVVSITEVGPPHPPDNGGYVVTTIDLVVPATTPSNHGGSAVSQPYRGRQH